MAYGDNRSEIASDTFDSSIDSSWDTGWADWNNMIWVSGGYVDVNAAGTKHGMRRNTGTYADDQYSIITNEEFDDNDVGAQEFAIGRAASGGADESCYFAEYSMEGDIYELEEVTSSFGFSSLASASHTGALLAQGDTITIECEGTTMRMGTNEGSGDTERITATDATLTSGRPGLGAVRAGSATVRITDWSGGDISAAGGSVPAIMINRRQQE